MSDSEVSVKEMMKAAKEASKNGGKYEMPEGDYTASMTNVKSWTNPKGEDKIILEFVIRNPGDATDKQKFSKWYNFEPQGVTALYTDMEMAGKPIDEADSLMDMVGKVYDKLPVDALVKVKRNKANNGNIYTNYYVNGPAEYKDGLPF